MVWYNLMSCWSTLNCDSPALLLVLSCGFVDGSVSKNYKKDYILKAKKLNQIMALNIM